MISPRITLIVAYAHRRVIGHGNNIPWKIKGEQAHFKRVTDGHPIIMGRKTWESLPRKPLPGRRNLIISRNARFQADGAEVFVSLDAALAACSNATGPWGASGASGASDASDASGASEIREVFVIGGAQIYAQALPHAHRVIATEIELNVDGDAFFPALPAAQWREVERHPGPTDEGQPLHAFVTFERR